MGNQGKMERNWKFKTMQSIHDMQFLVFYFTKKEDMRSKVRQNKFGNNYLFISVVNMNLFFGL